MENSNILDAVCDPYIIINVPTPSPDDTICLSLENTIQAQCSLSPLAFFFYMIFVISKRQKSFLFPATDLCEAADLPYEFYVDAFTELLNDHYLVPTEIDPNIFYFHDSPAASPDTQDDAHDEQMPWDDDEW